MQRAASLLPGFGVSPILTLFIQLWKEQTIKKSRPFRLSKKGRECKRAYHILLARNAMFACIPGTRPWCHPVCPSPRERPLILVIALRGNRPPDPTCPLDRYDPDTHKGCRYIYRLSSASRSRRRSEGAYPFRTRTMLRIAVGRRPRTLFAQRGSDFCSVCKIAGVAGNVNFPSTLESVQNGSSHVEAQAQAASVDIA